MYNLVQSLKMLFLYTQNKKHTIKEYRRNFRSLWDTLKAFGGSPGLHKGMIDALMQNPAKVANVTRLTDKEIKRVHTEALEAVKAALLISRADKQRYGRLKEDLANNYLLGSDQYLDTFKKALRIFGKLPRAQEHPWIQGQPCERGSLHPARTWKWTHIRAREGTWARRDIRQWERCWE